MDSRKNLLMKQKEHLKKGKKGLLSIVFGRTGIVVLLLLIQVGILFAGFSFLSNYIFAVYGGTMILGLVLVVHIINKRGNPAFQIAWMVPILMIPVFGSLFYLFINMQIEAGTLNKRIMEEQAATASIVDQKDEVLEHLREESIHMANLACYLRRAGGSAVHENTVAEYYASGEAVFDTLLDILRNAKEYIFMEFFIVSPGYMWDSVLEILKAKAKEGIEVRFLYDGMCDFYQFSKNYPKELEGYGIKCKVFAPIVPALSTVQNNRDHRKILVVDGHTALTGGINLADEYINRKERFGYWKDSAIIFKGEAVQNFTLMFLRMWTVVNKEEMPDSYAKYIKRPLEKLERMSTGYVIPYGDNPLDDQQVAELVYMDILNTAERYVHIMTPYLVLDHEMMVALTFAAKRGVDVKIIMPHIPDKKYAFILARTYYNELLDAGVEIYEFLPGFVHSKIMVSDDIKAVVGSINLDFRSLYLSFECAALLYKNDEIPMVEKDFHNTLAQSQKVTKELYDKQPMKTKIAGKILRFLAPMM